MDVSNQEIAGVLKGCQKEQRESQKALYMHFYSYALSVCVRYSKSREDAVEIMNDSFLKVFKYIDKFDFNKPFKPWLRRILINCAIDHQNGREKEASWEDLEHKMVSFIEEPQTDALDYHDLLEMIRKLPTSYSTVFNLRAIEGYKHEEVAEMLGITIGTSKSNYAKARAKLQEYLVTYFGVKK